jgi:hypothetical protein
MKIRILLAIGAIASLASGLNAQTYRRQAAIVGGGNGEWGHCSIEIVVDGAAEIAIRGDDATVTNLKGQPPELRRFECTAPIPPNPAEFRFNGTDGRGRQQLVNAPLQGQPAVIRIEDPQDGADRYRFELTWRAAGPGPYSDRRDHDRDDTHRRFTTDQAVEVCQNAVRQQTSNRYRTNDVNFRQTHIDDAPGRGDWVIGTLEARHPGMPDQILKFSCSVDFGTGQVRSAQVDPLYIEGGPGAGPAGGRPGVNPMAMQNCRRAVEDRVHRDGYHDLAFGNIRPDDRPGRADWIVGDFQAVGPYGPENLRFSCNVEMRDGDVRSIDVTTRR